MDALNWWWITVESIAVPLVAVLVAWPLWRHEQFILGNVAGSAVIFASGIALILREHVELDRLVQDCLDAGTVCWPEPSAFTRFAIYASVALIETFVLFSVSLRIEQRMRGRDYAPEWRR